MELGKSKEEIQEAPSTPTALAPTSKESERKEAVQYSQLQNCRVVTGSCHYQASDRREDRVGLWLSLRERKTRGETKNMKSSVGEYNKGWREGTRISHEH
ncbi:hypothetical protein KQX54_020342 [Cotesia glomerata]|uniref:Uncharacterized protein n=1 Tax=Cotesia glomerata TaxID=32391 RepID=A0AAV7IHE9_COTGL|nr:hypothetical protein KQX54_020342 [Cotesia glomerata]